MIKKMILIAAAAMIGCQPTTTAVPDAWEGVLVGEPGFTEVSGTAVAETSASLTTVTASISGAEPGAVHPWHIHFGTCEDDGGIVGDPQAYPHLQPGADGGASATATVEVGLQPGQDYLVNVHASPDDLATIVACGDLTRR